ncbi:MAG: hypothetical protein JNJ81_05570 [Candidatus Accumulibacter sp.]|nr:hypothetical protein [Accumulibacter sp.]
MTDIPTTTIERCEPSQLKRLLSLAQGSGRQAEFLPAGLSGREELARHLTTLCDDSAQAGDALLSVTCAHHTALAVLQEIKELAKSLATKARSEPERAAAKLLYPMLPVNPSTLTLARATSSTGATPSPASSAPSDAGFSRGWTPSTMSPPSSTNSSRTSSR